MRYEVYGAYKANLQDNLEITVYPILELGRVALRSTVPFLGIKGESDRLGHFFLGVEYYGDTDLTKLTPCKCVSGNI